MEFDAARRRALSNPGFTGRIEQTGRGGIQDQPHRIALGGAGFTAFLNDNFLTRRALQIGVGHTTQAFGHLNAMGAALRVKGQMFRTQTNFNRRPLCGQRDGQVHGGIQAVWIR